MTSAFIVPLRSKQVSKSWSRVNCLLERTLRSICAQTVSDFQVVVVCHEKPEVDFNPLNVRCVEVSFPIPSDCAESKNRDKYRKIWTGLNSLKTIRPSHVTFVDSDDCVSRRITEFALKNHKSNGWHIEQGYEHPDDSEIVYFRKKNFHKKTGTSHILKYSLLEPFLNYEFDRITHRSFLFHQDISKIMNEMGFPLESLPFPGSAYITQNGENNLIHEKVFPPPPGMTLKETMHYYGGAIYKPFISKRLTSEIRSEFGLYKL
jgi:hypothetical protein